MLNLSTIFNKIKGNKNYSSADNNAGPNNNASNNQPVKSLKNWYEERTSKILIQRNILLGLTFLLLFLIIIAIIAITIVLNSRKFDPFVIQIDQTTGAAKVVTPVTENFLKGNEELAKYFVKKYLIARETYNPVDFETTARNFIRLCSNSNIFSNFLGYIKNPDSNPVILHGSQNTTFLTIKSWTKLDEKRYMIRFSVSETSGAKKTFNKIAVIDFDFLPMELSEADRDINPIGFQVTGYRVDDDNS